MLRERWWHRPLPLGHPHDLGGSTPTLSECSPTISQTARQPSTHQPSWRPISRSRRRFSLNEASSRIRAKVSPMATWDDVRRLTLALPQTVEGSSRDGLLGWRGKDKTFAWERPLRRGDLEALGDA